jgi:hypothetical protein
VELLPETAEQPAAVFIAGQRVMIAGVIDAWLIEDEWWRAPLSRYYVQLTLIDGRLLTIFHDRINDGWYVQHYSGAQNG